MPVSTDELVAFLTKLRQGAVAGVREVRDGSEGAFRQDVTTTANGRMRT